MADSSLLRAELPSQWPADALQLLLQTGAAPQIQTPDFQVVRPRPGLCVKTLSQPDQEKVFINVCRSDQVPPPPGLSREELVQLLQSEDPSGYRVPMSLGESHAEVDNSSNSCTVYDVVINQDFFHKCQDDPLFKQFLISVSVEGLENKYGLELSRDWKVLKNRRALGSIREQNIRPRSRAVIQELRPPEDATTGARRPEVTLLVEPPAGDPEHLIAEIKLPGVLSARSLVLDVGEDRLVLAAQPALFYLDIFHPFLIHQDKTVAQFNSSTQVLLVTMPVVSTCSC